jgi:hypothetical protein
MREEMDEVKEQIEQYRNKTLLSSLNYAAAKSVANRCHYWQNGK